MLALVLRLSMGSRRISGLSPSFHCSSVGHMVVRPALEGRMRLP